MTECPKVFPVDCAKGRASRSRQVWEVGRTAIARPAPRYSNSSSSEYEVQDQRNYGENQQQVNHRSCNVEHCKSAQPRDQQDNEQYRPNAHVALLYDSSPKMCGTGVILKAAMLSPTLCPEPAPVINRNIVRAGKSACTWISGKSATSVDLARGDLAKFVFGQP